MSRLKFKNSQYNITSLHVTFDLGALYVLYVKYDIAGSNHALLYQMVAAVGSAPTPSKCPSHFITIALITIALITITFIHSD